jgi:hypothetical protein
VNCRGKRFRWWSWCPPHNVDVGGVETAQPFRARQHCHDHQAVDDSAAPGWRACLPLLAYPVAVGDQTRDGVDAGSVGKLLPFWVGVAAVPGAAGVLAVTSRHLTGIDVEEDELEEITE